MYIPAILSCNHNTVVLFVHIQPIGYLAAPVLSVILFTKQIIKLKWVPPFTLDITNVDPDITSYSLHVWSLDTGEHVVITTNESEYTFVKDNLANNMCRIYEFTVAGVNTVGKGNRSSVIADFPAGMKLCMV